MAAPGSRVAKNAGLRLRDSMINAQEDGYSRGGRGLSRARLVAKQRQVFALGPTNVKPASLQARAKSARSARNP